MTTERCEPDSATLDGCVVEMVMCRDFDNAGVAERNQHLIVVDVCLYRVSVRVLVRRVQSEFRIGLGEEFVRRWRTPPSSPLA